MGVMPSPITGSAGNIEYLIHARTPLTGSVATGDDATGSVSAMLDSAVAEAHRAEPRG
jgi:hypothetical protein